MRYSIPVKFLAVLLAALSLVAVFAGTLGIWKVAELGLYTDGYERWIDNRLGRQAHEIAKRVVERYAVREETNCPEEFLQELGYWYVFQESIHWTGFEEDTYDVTIMDKGSVVFSQEGLPEAVSQWKTQEALSVEIPVMLTSKEEIDAQYGEEYIREETVYPKYYGENPVKVRYYESKSYTVLVNLDPDAMINRSGASLELIKLVHTNRYTLMVILAVALLSLAACIVFLSCVAGRGPEDPEIRPAGLNRLPLDLYAVAGGVAGWLLGRLAYRIIDYWILKMDNLNAGTLVLAGLVILAVALIIVGFFFCFAAQLKAKQRYWWRNTILEKLWQLIRQLGEMLPVVWVHLLTIVCMAGGLLAGGLSYAYTGQLWQIITASAVCLLIALYSGYAYGVVLKGAEKMAKGDLESKIDTRYLFGSDRRCAENLNALAEVAKQAAQNQLRAERLRTELITNVSHDIKTPLTSIINYVDLLHRAKVQEEAVQYLQVLSRQSQRLKKLVEDLLEMSKASTGNIPVELASVDPAEALQQAVGEFTDKLESRQLQTVLTLPEEQVTVLADGRLLWRVLSNLLSNIFKYALPGTRVYADVQLLDNAVQISLKNISAEPLNISADELMERFVRGDTSRNTEGSGLGLNIAKSLMELQKGQLQLTVDGDLFKATVILPRSTAD